MVTRPRKIKRRNTASDVNSNVNGTGLRSILKKNDLPFAIRGRRKSVSFGTVSRAPMTTDVLPDYESDLNTSDITLSEPSMSQPNPSSIGNINTLCQPGPSSIVTETVKTSSASNIQSQRAHSKRPLTQLLPLNVSPTLTIQPFGTPATYGKKMPSTPRRLAKGSTAAIVLNRVILESKNDNNLMDNLSPEKIDDPIDTNMDGDFGNIAFE